MMEPLERNKIPSGQCNVTATVSKGYRVRALLCDRHLRLPFADQSPGGYGTLPVKNLGKGLSDQKKATSTNPGSYIYVTGMPG
jgi:hypothetical protein